MAEALGLASSIVALVQLSASVYSATAKFCRQAKEAKSKISALATQTRNLSGVLQSLSLLASAPLFDDAGAAAPNFRDTYIESCRTTLHNIKRKLEKAEADFDSGSQKRLITRSLKWPFDSQETNDLIAELSQHQDVLQLALSAETMSHLLRCLANTNSIAESVDGLHRKLDRKASIDTRAELTVRREEIVRFFSNVNPEQYFQDCRKRRQDNTGRWLIERDQTFRDWIDSSGSQIWLSGIPGAGKTILCGTVVEEILQEQTMSTAVAFFFCDYKHTESQKPDNILAALAVQLAKQADSAFEVLESYYEELHPNNRMARPPETMDLIGVAQAMIEKYDRVYLVIDGLDECGSNVVEALQALKKLAKYRQVNAAFFSRNEPDIMEELAHAQRIEIAAHTEDLELYVLAQMEGRKRLGNLAVRNSKLHEYIRRTLIEGANGMFRWVACQLDYLDSLPSDGRRRKALTELPPTLFETYDRILDRIMQEDERDQELCRKALHWIGLGYKSIDPSALCEAISIPDDQDLVDEELLVDPDWISRSCSSLIRLAGQEFDSPHFEFAHFTVKEYLRSIKPESSRGLFRFAEDVAIRELLGSALRFLTFPIFDRRPMVASSELQQVAERNEQHPFYPIAASYLFSAAGGNSHEFVLGDEISLLLKNDTMMEYAKTLFSSHKTGAFLSWVLQVAWSWPYAELVEDHFFNTLGLLLAPEFTTLHMAAIFASPSICTHLIDSKVNINACCRLGTPLHALLAGTALLGPNTRHEYDPGWHIRSSTNPTRYNEARTCLEVFLEHGADTSTRWGTTTVLQMAINCSGSAENGWTRPLIIPSTTVTEDCIQFAKRVVESGGIDESILDAIVTVGSATGIANGWARLASIVQTWRMQQEHYAKRDLPLDDRVRISDEDFADGIRISLTQDLTESLTSFLQDQRFRPGMHITYRSTHAIPLLHFAIKHGSPPSVALLVEAGCDPQVVNEDNGWSTLHQCAFAATDGAAITSLLLRSGVVDSVKDKLGKTCWHIAAEEGNVPVLKVLVDMGIDTNRSLATTSNEGKTPLASALHFKRLQAALLLLEHCCADASFFQSDQSLLDEAAAIGSKDLFLVLYDKLTEAKATEAIHNSKPLFHINMSCSPELVDYLLCSWAVGTTERSSALTRFLLHTNTDDFQYPQGYPSRETIIHIVSRLLEQEHDSIGHDKAQRNSWEIFCEDVAPCFTDDVGHVGDRRHADLIGWIFEVFISNKVLTSYEQISQLPGYHVFFRALLRRSDCLAYLWVAPSVHKVIQASRLSESLASDTICIKMLSSAVRNNNRDLVRELLDRNVDVHTGHAYGSLSPLEEACYGSHFSLFDLIIGHSDKKLLNGTGSHGKTLLHWAVSANNHKSLNKIERLLQLEVNVDSVVHDPDEDTALTLASRTNLGYRQDIVALLVSWGANPLHRARDGWTILHAGAASGDLRFIQSLTPSETPVSFWQGTTDMYVRQYGFDVEKSTAVHFCAINGRAPFLNHLVQMQVPLDVNAVTGPPKLTPMHLAAEFGHLDVLEILFSLKANVNARDSRDLLPIDLAIRSGHIEVVKVLFKFGSKRPHGTYSDLIANLVSDERERDDAEGDSKEMSEFYFSNAILHGDLDMLKKMVEKGRSINSELLSESSSLTPLVFAVVNGQTRIVDWLISVGVEVMNPVIKVLKPSWRCTASLITHHIKSLPTLRAFLDLALRQNVTWYGSVIGPLHVAILDHNMGALVEILSHIRKNEHAYRKLIDSESISLAAGTGWHNRNALSILVNEFRCKEACPVDWPWPWHEEQPYDAPLHTAIGEDNLFAVKLLLKHDADVNQVDSWGRSPLLLAVRTESSPEIIRELLNAGAGPADRLVAVKTATSARDPEVVKILTEADPETLRATDHFLPPGLFWLAGSVEVFAYLLCRGLRPSNHQSIGFFGFPIQTTDDDFSGFIINSGLLSHATDGLIADVFSSALDDSNFVAIRWLYRTVRSDLFSSLLNDVRLDWASPLCVAASRDEIKQAEDLIKMGADIDLDGCLYGSALMAACVLGHLVVARCLVRSGASLYYVNKDGLPRSAVSLSSRHQGVMRWLLVERHLEQPKLEYQDSPDTSHRATWSGPRLFKLVLPAHMHRDICDESSWDHLCRLQKWKQHLLGSTLAESRNGGGLDFDAELLAESRKTDAQAAHRQFLTRLGEH